MICEAWLARIPPCPYSAPMNLAKPSRRAPSAEVLAALKEAAGPGGYVEDPALLAPHLVDWRGRKKGVSPLLLRPDSTERVQAIVRVAAEARVGLVPQGGNSSLVGGSVPEADGASVLMHFGRMQKIRALDVAGQVVIAEAGVVLQQVQEAARAQGLMFPLSLAARGTAMVGGLISTNAGGVQVLRHGPMRAQVLGLEAVMADGSLLDQLAPLRKDNTGYDIKQLLIGAEGTLGLITAASLKLVPAPQAQVHMLLGVENAETALQILSHLRRATGEMVESFEYMPATALTLVAQHIEGLRLPMETLHPVTILCEIAGAMAQEILQADVEKLLAELHTKGWVRDALIAQNQAQAEYFWRLREEIPQAERMDGFALKHDVAVPVDAMPRFMEEAQKLVEQNWAGARVLAFGHLGDGNVHFNVRPPLGMKGEDFLRQGPAMAEAVYALVTRYGGSISAEHGIGTLRIADLDRVANPAKRAAQRAIKAALDPHHILNPGKLF